MNVVMNVATHIAMNVAMNAAILACPALRGEHHPRFACSANGKKTATLNDKPNGDAVPPARREPYFSRKACIS
jgi:hypothetical protein